MKTTSNSCCISSPYVTISNQIVMKGQWGIVEGRNSASDGYQKDFENTLNEGMRQSKDLERR